MSVTVILECHAKPDAVEEVKGLFARLVDDARGFEGCRSLTILQDQDDPTTIVGLHQWDSRDHYLRYVAWRQERGELDEISALLTGRVRRFLDDTGI